MDAFDIYRGSLVDSRSVFYPQDNVDAERLFDRIADLRSSGKHIAIADGAFDVPHDNHVWYLRECRRVAAERCFAESYRSADRVGRRHLIARDDVVLVVTVDADAQVDKQKSWDEAKGGVSRPVYPWPSRASRVAGYMIPMADGRFRPVVDLVTVEGDPAHAGTPLQSHDEFGSELLRRGLLDTWIIYSRYTGRIARAVAIASESVCLIDAAEATFATDPRTGADWSSTYVINRIRGR